jgi:pimeloyl-ACP methyl ester carboxylesterase
MSVQYLDRPDGARIAFQRTQGMGPTVLWVGGFRSDMEGTKALELEAAAQKYGWAYVRYDHFAHGASSGDWREATIGRWREDALTMIDAIEGPILVVGSSMGGWVALLAALARPERVSGLVLVAPAPDFTERLMWPGLDDHLRQAILRDGEVVFRDHAGLGDYVLTRRLFDEARQNWLLLDGPIAISAPVHILQGKRDDAVPWTHALTLAERLDGGDARLDLIDEGDHRLSTPRDLARLVDAVANMRDTLANA